MRTVEPPSYGEGRSWLDAVVCYAEACDGAWLSRAAGASADEIGRLQSLAEAPLPGVYREYLTRLGRSDGGLLCAIPAYFDVETIIEYYEDCVRFEPEENRADVLICATGTVGLDQLAFDLRDGSYDPEVWHTSNSEFVEFYAASFRDLVAQAAFSWGESRLRSVMLAYGGSENALERARRRSGWWDVASILRDVERAVTAAGLRVTSFSDRWHLAAWAEDVSLSFTLSQGRRPVYQVFAASASRAARLGDRLAEMLDATRVQ